MLMVNLVTEIQKHFPSLRRIRNASRLADPSGANDGDPIALWWLCPLVESGANEWARNMSKCNFFIFFQDRYLVCHRYVIASDGPISDFTQYFIGSITNHSCDFDMLYFSMASYSGWCFGTFGWFFPSYWECHHPNWLSLHHFPEG